MPTMSCKAWPSSQSWERFSSALVASGRSSRNANGMMISKNSMTTKTTIAMTRTTFLISLAGTWVPDVTVTIDGAPHERTRYRLDDRLALVTGASGNLGGACCRELAAAGATFEHVVKVNNYLIDMAHLPIYFEVRDRYVDTKAPPASTTIQISKLAREGALYEIEAIAVVPEK